MTLPLRRKLAYAAAAQLLVLGGLEAGLRVAGLPRATERESPLEFVGIPLGAGAEFPMEWDDELFWRMVPGAPLPRLDERIGARGFRGAQFPTAKPPGVRRIVCLGDSNVFGMGVELGETFSARLGEWLRPAGRHEVLNLGVPGFSVVQIRRLLLRRALPLSPDLVIVYPGAWNDYAPAIGADDRTVAARLDRGRGLRDGLSSIPLRSLELARRWMRAPRAKREPVGGKYLEDFAARHELPDGPRVPLEVFREELRAISRDARAAGARGIFVTPAAPRDQRRRFPESDAYAQAVRDVAREEGDPLVDARADLDLPEEDAPVLYADAFHPSACGHSWIAAGIATTMSTLPGFEGLESLDAKALRDPLPVDLSRPLARAAERAASSPSAEGGLVQAFPLHASVAVGCPSRLVLPEVDLPARPRLEVACAVINSTVGEGSVRFRVEAEGAGSILSEEVVPVAGEPISMRSFRVALPAILDGKARLVFSAEGPAPTVFWIRPQVVSGR